MKEITEKEIQNLLYNIAWLRKQHGFSRKQMAALLGISVGTLNKIERGELPPRISARILFRLCAHFGIHPKDFFVKRFDEA